MKVATTVCKNCGESVLEDAPKGLCPACVLETGLGLPEDQAVAGVGDSGRAAEVLMDFGDYELLEEIGRGGQGVVYRARQKSLNRTVALKVIGLGQWAPEAHLKRFRREAESAANLDHPWIVPIYDVGEREGSCYFSMKFIDGGQLDEVAKRTPISIRTAAELIAKLARTLHYAHEHGILHRDIKPGNILVDTKGEPHLTDFGLARLLETKSTVTHTMDVLGTPSYMAPEQASGHNEQLTSATDVYGLGAVFYQLLTGHPPFAGGTTYETVRLVLETEPRQPRLLNPKINRELSTICLKCLEKDPRRRYSSALALAEDLEHWLKHEPIRAKRSGLFTHSRKWVRRNPSTAALVILSFAVAIGLGVLVWNHKPAVPVSKSVAVLPFENLSDDKEHAFFADGVQDDILTKLAKVADLKVISRTSVMQYRGKQDLRQIGQALGVSHVLEGTVRRSGEKVHINAQLVDTRTDTHIWAEEYHRDLNDVFAIEAKLAQSLVSRLSATLSASEKLAMQERPTNDLVAYDLYIRAKTLIASAYLSTPGYERVSEAVRLLNQAIEHDPAFALAYYQLAYAYDQLYFGGADHTPAGLAMADAAIQSLTRLRPDSDEAHLALATHLYWGYRDYERARQELKLAQKSLPNDSMAFFILASIDRRQGRWAESTKNFERAIELDPQNPSILSQPAENYQCLRRYADAERVLDRRIALSPNDSAMRAKRALIEFQWHADPYQLTSTIEAIIAEDSREAQNVAQPWLFGSLCQRDFDGARRALAVLPIAGCQENNFPFPRAWCEGVVAQMRGDIAAARAAFGNGRIETGKLVAQQPDYPEGLSVLGMIDAALGHKEDAIREGRRAVELLPVTKDAIIGAQLVQNLALIYAWTGEKDFALQQLAVATNIPFDLSYGELRLHPYWDPLRGDPRFEKIVTSLAPKETTSIVAKSVAVLPFENLSNDPDNAYLADGIQEEILTRLVSIADLKVISRTSTQRYQSKPRSLGEIAKQLGVANILEGSVQKVADQVRVNVQLVNAQTDSHLWAETYDRKLTDIFEVESEIAKRIVESLQAKLTGREEQALAVRPTNNPEAYEAYLRGLAFDTRNYSALASPDVVAKAAGFYERAVQLDPNFAIAWARLSRADARVYFNSGPEATSALGEAAKRALENAQKLEPNSPETLLALGYYQYWVLRDYGSAHNTFGRLSKMLPSRSEVLMALGRVTRREGHWDESVAYFEQALTFDPRDLQLLTDSAETYAMLGQFPAALKLYDRVLDITPSDPDVMAAKVSIFQAQGNLQQAARFLSEINWHACSTSTFITKIWQLRFERNYGEAIRLLETRLAQFHYASQDDKGNEQMALAWIKRLAGDTAGAKATAEQARNIFEPLYTDQSGNFRASAPRRRAEVAARLSEAYALTGQKDSALKTAEHATMLFPPTEDPVVGPAYEENLALIQTMFGENSRAISTLTRLLQTPYAVGIYTPTPITPALLKLDPIWDPLRSDPRFQKLCEEKQPPATP